MVTGTVRLSEDAPYCQVSDCSYTLQRAIPSARGRFTPRSLSCLHGRRRNIDRLAIGCPLRVPLSPRLTLIRLTLFRKPWVFGVYVSTYIVVTYAYIFFSSRSSIPHGTPSRLHWNAPLPMLTHPIASATVLMPAHHPRNAARLVSCYALFE